MGRWAIGVLRAVIAVALLGALAVQAFIVAALVLGWDSAEMPPVITVPLVVLLVAIIACLQLVGACIWRLLSRVRRGTVFSPDSFGFVDAVVWALGACAVLVLGVAVVLRAANQAVPEDAIAPFFVALTCGLALVTAGVALVVHVLKVLLRQAVGLDAENRTLHAELDEVI